MCRACRRDRARNELDRATLNEEYLVPVAKAPPIRDNFAHWPQAPLRWFRDPGWMLKSQVILCRKAAKTAAVFIHGWGGDAGGTWEMFPKALTTLPAAASADAYLVDYPSISHQVPFCAAQLRRFLVDLVEAPVEVMINRSLPSGAPRRSPNDTYERIILVGHSMGAVIARRALLDIEKAPPPSITPKHLEKFKLLFFAPAHLGSDLPLLIGAGFHLDKLPAAKLIGSLILLWKPSLRDLEKGSASLNKLASDCRELRERREAKGESTTHLRANVYHAERDRVVYQDDFDNDFPFTPVMQRNHRNVCKPDASYLTPVEALRKLL